MRSERPGAARDSYRCAVALLLLGLAGPFESSAPLAASGARVRAVPAARAIAIGETVVVTVRIEGARDVGSTPFTLHFDPAILEFVAGSAVEGSFLGRDGTATSFLAAPGPASRGGGVVVGLSRLRAGRGAQGKGVLCRLTFRARSPGITPVSFARANVLSPAASPLPVAFKATAIEVRPAR
ncbi:MAG TPA: cohesin domain-containing protein [Candidatus Polarisedimenticolia bacterium]